MLMTELAHSYNTIITRRRLFTDPLLDGWKVFLEEVSDAYVLPQTSFGQPEGADPNGVVRAVYDGGVYRSNGEIVESSLHIELPKFRNTPTPSPASLGSNAKLLKGCWLFGGMLKVDFGHTVTEGLGRLWGLDHWPGPIEGVVFVRFNGVPSVINQLSFSSEVISRSAAVTMSRWAFIPELLDILTASRPVHLVGQPVRVERLVVPSQLMGLVNFRHIGGHEVYRKFVKERLRAVVPYDRTRPVRKIYVSRSRMPVKSSFFFLEHHLESLLALDGYEVMHPETMPIAEQVKTFLEASHVILATGSAAHMLALAGHPEQRVLLLHRHRGAWKGFGHQLKQMGVGQLTERDYTTGHFIPVDEKVGNKLSLHPARTVHSIGLRELWEELLNLGYVRRPFVDPPASMVQDGERVVLDELGKAFSGAAFHHASLDPTSRRR